MHPLKRQLEAANVGPVFCLSTSTCQSFHFNEIEAQSQIQDIYGKYPGLSPRCVVIGHSKGGLIGAGLTQSLKNIEVTHFFSLGTPFGGSPLAPIAIGPDGKSMAPGSPFLRKLKTRFKGERLPEKCFCIVSKHDGFIYETIPKGATKVSVSGMGHLYLAFSPKIGKIIIDQLETSTPSRPVRARGKSR